MYFFRIVVDGNEIDDRMIQRNILEVPFDERVSLLKEENEHILSDYTEYVKHLIAVNWPEVFPEMTHHQGSSRGQAP